MTTAKTRRRQRASVTPDDVMMEREVENGILRILNDLPAVLGYHTRRSDKSKQGFPDWVFAGPGGVAFCETKREHEELEPEQQVWLDMLLGGGATAYVRRPSDLRSGLMAMELATLAQLRIHRPPHGPSPVEAALLGAVIRDVLPGRDSALADLIARAVLRAGYTRAQHREGTG